jgi:hypothetical protein
MILPISRTLIGKNKPSAMKMCSLLFLLLLSASAYSQDLRKAEEGLLTKFQRISYWRDYRGDDTTIDAYDSIYKANAAFARALIKIAAAEPASLIYNFNKLQDSGLTIATSGDNRLRIYSWDSEEGGTMHNFLSVTQFGNQRRTWAYGADTGQDDDYVAAGAFYTPIYTFHVQGKTYYLVISHNILSNKDVTQGIYAYRINNNSLDDTVKLFKTRTGLRNGISFAFDFFSVVNRPERPIQLIHFDPEHKSIRIPVVLKNGTVTNRFIVYCWTGHYFERK